MLKNRCSLRIFIKPAEFCKLYAAYFEANVKLKGLSFLLISSASILLNLAVITAILRVSVSSV